MQASIRTFRDQLRRHSLSGYAGLFDQGLPPEFLAQTDPTRHLRHFGHNPVFWAWLGQILEGNASCQKAFDLLQNCYQGAGLPVPSGGTGGWCLARGRLGLLQFDHGDWRATSCNDSCAPSVMSLLIWAA